MAIKIILVPLAGVGDATAQLETALSVGRAHDAHVEGFHVSLDPREGVAFVGEGMTSAMVEDVMAATEAETRSRLERARAVFDETCKRLDVKISESPTPSFSASFSTATGREYDLVARRGRLTDLVVAGRPAGEEEAAAQAVLEVALMETARPLLIAPPTAAKTFGRSVIIAWNGSVEAIRAVSSALPYLTRAESVIILVIGEGDRPPALPDDLKAYFAWHGIAVTGKQVAAESAPVGARLLEEADAAGADLLVMGGYTHSRLRQLIFGGVTSHVLHHAELPVLMAH